MVVYLRVQSTAKTTDMFLQQAGRLTKVRSSSRNEILSRVSSNCTLVVQVALGILQRIGFKEVVCAADGVNALSEMTVRGGGDAFDIVLTDLHMPRKVGTETFEYDVNFSNSKMDTSCMCCHHSFIAAFAALQG